LLLPALDGAFYNLEPPGGKVELRIDNGSAVCRERSFAAGLTIDCGYRHRLRLADGQGLRQSRVQGRVDVALVTGLLELAHETAAPRCPVAFRGLVRHVATAVTRATRASSPASTDDGVDWLCGCRVVEGIN